MPPRHRSGPGSFSGKKKKEQLQAKKARQQQQQQQQGSWANEAFESTVVEDKKAQVDTAMFTSQPAALSSEGRGGGNGKNLRTVFAREETRDVELRRFDAMRPVDFRLRGASAREWWEGEREWLAKERRSERVVEARTDVGAGVDAGDGAVLLSSSDVSSVGGADGGALSEDTGVMPVLMAKPGDLNYVDMPRRPPQNANSRESTAQLEAREEAAFQAYLSNVYSKFPRHRLNFFEHNLEVWRQLWRVCELSDVLMLLVDARFPLFHLPPALYDYVTRELHKPLVVVMNKSDLVDDEVVVAWERWLTEQFPALVFIRANAFQAYATGTDGQKKRKALKRKFESASGLERILEAIATIMAKRHDPGADGIQAQLDKIKHSLRVRREQYETKAASGLTRRQTKGPKHQAMVELSSAATSDGSGFGVASASLARNKNRKQKKRALARARAASGAASSGTSASSDVDGTDDEDNESSPALAPKLGTDILEQEIGGSDSVSDSEDFDSQLDLAPTAETMSMSATENAGTIRVGFVGHPNVGKSSLINGFMGEKVVSASRQPGHTKYLQTINLAQGVQLLDCPGLVFPAVDRPKALQIVTGCFPTAQVREPYSAIRYLAERVPIERMYGLNLSQCTFSDSAEWSPWAICEAYAVKRGYYTARSKGKPDTHRAGLEIIYDCIDGKIPIMWPAPVGAYSHNSRA